MNHYSSKTYHALKEAFGFPVEIISSQSFIIDNEIKKTRYTVKRKNGKKFYHAFMFVNGEIDIVKI